MSSRNTNTPHPETQPALPEPPPARLYVRHAVALAEAMHFVTDHWHSFESLVPEAFVDGVAERKVTVSLNQAVTDFNYVIRRLTIFTSLSDELYRQRVARLAQTSEYEPVEQLAVIQRMRIEAEAYKDQRTSLCGTPPTARGGKTVL